MLSFVGALVATYFLSRAFLHFMGRSAARASGLVAAHLLSFLLLGLSVGLLKAYFTAFAYGAAMVFALPQLIWFLYDLVRGGSIRLVSRR